jgi:hypothetical protein
VREIHTISDGITGGGESNSIRKAYARGMQSEEVYCSTPDFINMIYDVIMR